MTSFKSFNRRVGSLFGVAALVLATVTPGLVPSFASAAQVTERSVELSSSSKTATGVSYKITFTAVAASAGATVVNFCSNSPLAGEACAAPAGFSAAAATTSTSGATIAATTADATHTSAVILTKSIDNTAPTVLTLDNVTNPSDAGPLYVRIFTYDTEAHAQAYQPTSYNVTGFADQGSAAASITDSVSVSAAVLESMIFCVSGATVDGENCTTNVPANSGVLPAPVVRLGEGTGEVRALDAQHVSTGSIFSQISTNAASGAIVSLKSATTCGGLKRLAVTNCDIAAAGTGGITAGQAKFGVKVESDTDPTSGANSTGAYQIFGTTEAAAWYSSSVFKLNYDNTAAAGITSPYGDKLLDTNSAPANNKNIKITFGASTANDTPAGTYSTNLSLIATGKF